MSRFKNHRDAAAFMLRMGRALKQSNVPISPFISRLDNNKNFNISYQLIECGKRIADQYGRVESIASLRAKIRRLRKKGQKPT